MNLNDLLTEHADFIRGFSAAILTVIIGSALVAVGVRFFNKAGGGDYPYHDKQDHDNAVRWRSADEDQ
ncbi:MAG TPA: hypothetical protein VK968_07685 [Roseimicrobium sp.]|nr:hypothetical protein [Roseimicrobium sp.]